MNLRRAAEWSVLVAVVGLGLLLLHSAAWGQAPDPCQVALDNANAVQLTTQDYINRAAGLPRASSGRRLAVLQAKEARGFYTSMRVLLPLACRGPELPAIDGQLVKQIDLMSAFVQENW
jgi:hypothetical protein